MQWSQWVWPEHTFVEHSLIKATTRHSLTHCLFRSLLIFIQRKYFIYSLTVCYPSIHEWEEVMVLVTHLTASLQNQWYVMPPSDPPYLTKCILPLTEPCQSVSASHHHPPFLPQLTSCQGKANPPQSLDGPWVSLQQYCVGF